MLGEVTGGAAEHLGLAVLELVIITAEYLARAVMELRVGELWSPRCWQWRVAHLAMAALLVPFSYSHKKADKRQTGGSTHR